MPVELGLDVRVNPMWSFAHTEGEEGRCRAAAGCYYFVCRHRSAKQQQICHLNRAKVHINQVEYYEELSLRESLRHQPHFQQKLSIL